MQILQMFTVMVKLSMPKFGKNTWPPSWFLGGGGAIFPILNNGAPLSLSVSLSLCVITVNFHFGFVQHVCFL